MLRNLLVLTHDYIPYQKINLPRIQLWFKMDGIEMRTLGGRVKILLNKSTPPSDSLSEVALLITYGCGIVMTSCLVKKGNVWKISTNKVTPHCQMSVAGELTNCNNCSGAIKFSVPMILFARSSVVPNETRAARPKSINLISSLCYVLLFLYVYIHKEENNPSVSRNHTHTHTNI